MAAAHAAIPRLKRDPVMDRRADRIKAAGEYEWKDAEVVYTSTEKGTEGWQLLCLKSPEDLAYLGFTMGHCAGTHWVWVCEEKTWYFFVLVDASGKPRDTVHCKWEKWAAKTHPRDPNGRGYGEMDGMDFPATVKQQLTSIRRDRVVPYSGGYLNFLEVTEAFKRAGLEYEPGKYKATFLNTTYGAGSGNEDYGGNQTWDGVYRYYAVPECPPGVSLEIWTQYQKVMQTMKAEYDKKNGNVKVGGRVFPFDGKKLVVLTYNYTYKLLYSEWLIAMNKKKKEVVSG